MPCQLHLQFTVNRSITRSISTCAPACKGLHSRSVRTAGLYGGLAHQLFTMAWMPRYIDPRATYTCGIWSIRHQICLDCVHSCRGWATLLYQYLCPKHAEGYTRGV